MEEATLRSIVKTIDLNACSPNDKLILLFFAAASLTSSCWLLFLFSFFLDFISCELALVEQELRKRVAVFFLVIFCRSQSVADLSPLQAGLPNIYANTPRARVSSTLSCSAVELNGIQFFLPKRRAASLSHRSDIFLSACRKSDRQLGQWPDAMAKTFIFLIRHHRKKKVLTSVAAAPAFVVFAVRLCIFERFFSLSLKFLWFHFYFSFASSSWFSSKKQWRELNLTRISPFIHSRSLPLARAFYGHRHKTRQQHDGSWSLHCAWWKEERTKWKKTVRAQEEIKVEQMKTSFFGCCFFFGGEKWWCASEGTNLVPSQRCTGRAREKRTRRCSICGRKTLQSQSASLLTHTISNFLYRRMQYETSEIVQRLLDGQGHWSISRKLVFLLCFLCFVWTEPHDDDDEDRR